jgi:histidinol-phosphate aminotransferase
MPRTPAVERAVHGSPDFEELARLGISPTSLLDFSVNSNPLGTSRRALQAMQMVDPAAYPDDRCLRLRGGLASAHDVQPEQVLVGNGSVEVIWLLARAYLAAGDRALAVGPTFGEYRAATLAQGAAYAEVRPPDGADFQPDLDDIALEIAAQSPRVVFLCNPNNPTGQVLELDEIQSLLDALDDGLLVVDEAYIDLADGVASTLALQRRDPRVVVLRSLTKSHGLAGLRLGYLVAAPSIVRALDAARPPWTVNALAQAAGLAALGDDEHVASGLQAVRRAKAWLVDGLERLGLTCVPSRASFWLVEVGPGEPGGRGGGALVRDALLRRGILVRDAASFGLPSYIRVAARPLEECERLLGALSWLISSGRLVIGEGG